MNRVCDTQVNATFNTIKAKIYPKSNHFRKSFSIKCQLVILRWEDKDYYETLNDKLLQEPLTEDCQNVLDNDKNMLKKWDTLKKS